VPTPAAFMMRSISLTTSPMDGRSAPASSTQVRGTHRSARSTYCSSPAGADGDAASTGSSSSCRPHRSFLALVRRRPHLQETRTTYRPCSSGFRAP